MIDFNSLIDDFFKGHCIEAYKFFGAHFVRNGVEFVVYAPHAMNVQVKGSFNDWDGNRHWLKKIDDRGVWKIFIANVKQYALYKYSIQTADGNWIEKSDPFGYFSELRPKTSSITYNLKKYKWNDKKWMKIRDKNFDKPMSIYECHLGSWRRNYQGEWLTLDQWINDLIPYVKDNGFTHIELMPINEHPFDGSWGYQATGYYAVTSRYGTPDELKYFIDVCHQNNIGVILDVVPAHFVKDSHGLSYFDGQPVFEYPNEHDANNNWGTLNFNLWDECVRSFLMSSFAFWCDMFHIDGLRFDAIAHLLHWDGNKNRGENEGALDFLRRSNYYLSSKFPNVMLIAEDSSDFSGVTKPTFEYGLGFDYKWDLGWMNDTLRYYKLDPIHRSFHHQLITFSMLYYYSDRFLLPFSHDEVVHMKGSIINKLWGNYDQKFSQLRNLMGYMFAHPGKKLNFMGNEIGSFNEWSESRAVDFELLEYPIHSAYLRYFRDLNLIYKYYSCLYCYDYDSRGFYWIDPNNNSQSIFSFVREDEDFVIVCILNMTPISYEDYKIGVPYAGEYIELINSEKDIYNGCNMCNFEPLFTHEGNMHNFNQYLNIRIAPFACIYFLLEKPENF